MSTVPTSLPAPRTPLVGRTAELDQLEALMHGSARLVTITGPPGVGKTRLATQLGWRMLQAGQATRTSVHRVLLSAVRTAAGVAEAVAQTLGLSLAGGPAEATAPEQVALALPGCQPLVLILDNFEQLVPTAEETVGRWLGSCVDVCFLVTSRHALAIPGERRLELSPLPPDDAVELFVARACEVSPAFVMNPGRQQVIQALVNRLDRLPLAIELAAQRTTILSPEAIRDRLEDRFALLQTTGRQLDRRHVTLRETIEWSWSLLDDDERRALCACTIFAGSFDVDAVAAVLPADADALRLVQTLRERSLLDELAESTDTGAKRFRLLESIRDYAREQLEQRADAAALRRRYVAYFVGLAAPPSGQVAGQLDAAALLHLRREMPNLLEAWELAADEDPEQALQLALLVGSVRALLGPHEAHLELLDRAEALAARRLGDSTLHARVLIQRADARNVTGQRRAATADLVQAVRMTQANGTADLEAQAQLILGAIRRDEGEFAAGRDHFDRAAALFTTIGDRAQLGHTVGAMATLLRQQGRLAQARSCYERALALHREAGNPGAEGTELAGLGHLEAAAGDRQAARRWYGRALARLEQVGDLRTRGVVLDRLAGFALQDGDADAAVPLLQQADEHLATVGDAIHRAIVQAHLAVAAASRGERSQAQRGIEQAAAVLEQRADPRLWACISALRLCVELAGHRAALRDGSGAQAATALRAAAPRAAKLLAAGAHDYVEYATDANNLLARLLEAAAPSRGQAPASAPVAAQHAALRIGAGGRWFVLPTGQRVSLKSSPVQARLLAILAAQHQQRRGVGLPAEELFAQVWPDGDAGKGGVANRLYVAIAALRQRGLDGILIRQGDGYLLLPSLDCVIEDHANPQ